MKRLLATMKLDVLVQIRTNLYQIGLSASVWIAAILAWLATPEQLGALIPTVMLLIVGGSTLLYVAALIIFEKDEGTLNAAIVSPLLPAEYLWSKIVTLTGLAALESTVMFGGAMGLMWYFKSVVWPNVPILYVGIVAIGVLYTLVGIILVVRYDKITDFLVPMSVVAVVLQLPFIYFLEWVTHPLLLLIPTSGPGMIMRGAYVSLSVGEWVYALGYTTVLIVGLTVWAQKAFQTHVVLKVG
ncbi:MAG TPA: hypothetical protein VLL52_20045 [Anaerolineae bacterium]|nr:hypothetical protein [Anaerolineae bacterium]